MAVQEQIAYERAQHCYNFISAGFVALTWKKMEEQYVLKKW